MKPLDDPIPVAQLAEPAPAKSKKGVGWAAIAVSAAALVCIFLCGGTMGLLIGTSVSRPVRISATTNPETQLGLQGASRVRITYQAVGELDDRLSYLWVVRHGNQSIPPRFISAAEMRQGGVVEFYLFDYHATSAEIWIETDYSDGRAQEKISNVVRVRTAGPHL